MSFLERQEHLTSLLQEDRFWTWLEAYEDDQPVGRAGMPEACPIAQYLRSRGWNSIHVDSVGVRCGLTEVPTPTWARVFINKVDIHTDYRAITKAMVVRFLGGEEGVV